MDGHALCTRFSVQIWRACHAGKGRRLNGLLGLSLSDRTILFLEILLDKTVSVG